MNHTAELAQVLGILFLVGGLNAVFNRKAMAAALQDIDRSPALLWVWGFFNLLFGAAVIALHNVWTRDWRVLVTILGWASLVKGIWLILLPDSARSAYRASNQPRILASGGVVAIALGVFLLWVK